jgi:hypothetical protein
VAKEFRSRVIKAERVDEQLGLVFGWGMICTKAGEPYFDLQNQHCPPALMVKSTTDFMAHSRVADDMHDEVEHGPVVHSFPLTDEAMKAYGITCETQGWMIAVRPSPPILAKFVSGEYTGFSVGGFYAAEEVTA